MKIILLVSKLSGGGAERVASEMSLHLPADVERIFVLLEEKTDYPYEGDIRVLKSEKVGKYNIFARFFNIISRLLQFRKIVKQERPDWVIAFSPSLCLLSSLVFKNTVARANTLHSSAEGSFFSKLKIRWVYKRAKIVTAISQGVAEDLRDSFGIKKEVTVIHNPLDIEFIQKSGEEEVSNEIFNRWRKESVPIIVNAGRMENQKGQWHLVRSFREVLKKRKCKLLILGDGGLRNRLEKLSKDLGLENDVLFTGFQNNPYVYFQRSDVFVFSSLYEGFGKVVTEAMACGLPVISTDCRSGPREILAPDTDFRKEAKEVEYGKYGILTTVPDGKWRGADEPLTPEEEQLANAMYNMISDQGEIRKSYSDRSLKRAKDFDVKNWIDRWLSVLKFKENEV